MTASLLEIVKKKKSRKENKFTEIQTFLPVFPRKPPFTHETKNSTQSRRIPKEFEQKQLFHQF